MKIQNYCLLLLTPFGKFKSFSFVKTNILVSKLIWSGCWILGNETAITSYGLGRSVKNNL